MPIHRVLQWNSYIDRTFCTESESERLVVPLGEGVGVWGGGWPHHDCNTVVEKSGWKPSLRFQGMAVRQKLRMR